MSQSKHHYTGIGFLLACGLLVAASPQSEWTWRRLAWNPRLETVSAEASEESNGEENGEAVTGALAGSEAPGEVAVGDERGAWWSRRKDVFERASARPFVQALAFDADGFLFTATEDGLFRVGRDLRSEDRSPDVGAAARDVLRLAVRGGWIAAATRAGVYLGGQEEGSREMLWEPLSDPLPRASARALAFVPGSASELWIGFAEELWRVRFSAAARGFHGFDSRRVLALGPGEELLDLVFAKGETRPLVLTSRALWWAEEADAAWQREVLALPPGAHPMRLEHAFERVWIGTTRGLFFAQRSAGPWERAELPAAGARVVDLEAGATALLVLTEAGFFAAEVARGAEPLHAEAEKIQQDTAETRTDTAGVREISEVALREQPAPVLLPAPLPPIEEVHRAALRYLGLGRGRLEKLTRGVERRGFLPEFEVELFGGRERSFHKAFDEAFISGLRHEFNDWDLDRSLDYGASVSLSWDFGDTLYHPEAIDVSRERRELIELRDAVLDEVTQLYFERQRVLLEAQALAAQDAGEAQRRKLRARELTAGIDAWTGGWFSRALAAHAGRSHRITPLIEEEKP